jgi:methionyl-tRNA formyltransferase
MTSPSCSPSRTVRLGRGLQPQPSAVKALAERLGLVVAQPRTLREPAAVAQLAARAADVMVVAAYGLILPPAVLALPRLSTSEGATHEC